MMWKPILVTDLVPGDIIKIDGNPVQVNQIKTPPTTGGWYQVVTDRYTSQPLLSHWMFEAWR